MRRRDLLVVLIGAAAAWPLAPAAQQPRRTVGVLMPYPATDTEVRARVAAFRDQLRQLGWSEGENLRIEQRWSTDNLERVRADAAELVRLGPDVIFITGGRVVPILQQQTRSIPTVFAGVSDPLGQGLVTSLARPGGNLTGMALPPYSIVAKLVEILKQIAPGVSRAALMFNPDNPSGRFYWQQFEAAAPVFAIQPVMMPVHRPADIERAIATFAQELHGGLVLPSDLTLRTHRALVTDLATRHRLPAIYSDRVMVMSGGLASYSADRTELFRRGALYVDRILQGEYVGNLPVQQPEKFELVINLKTANALGITVPSTLLVSANEVIE